MKINYHTIQENPTNELIQRLRHAPAEEVVHQLIMNHKRYETILIPKIEQNFMGIMKYSPNNPALPVIFNLFQKFRISLSIHMRMEEERVFPLLLDSSKKPDQQLLAHLHDHDHKKEEPFLREIIGMISRCEEVENPFFQLLKARLENFQFELEEHARIEEEVLVRRILDKNSL